MTKFIFFGRLVKEKGIDMILDVFTKLYQEGMSDRHLEIYGVGPYDKACEAFEMLLPDNVSFHGWGDHHAVISRLPEKDFCLMPSRVIETFGLTALESIRAGVSVIGFKKGGTEPFIADDLNIDAQAGKTHTDQLCTLIKHILINEEKEFPLHPASLNVHEYTPQKRLENFTALAGDTKRILIVSDFTKRVGGIENYIHDAKDLLSSHGYTVELWGTDKKNSFGGLFKTACNISAWRKLRTKVSTFQPDIVRCHSVMRELGRLPLTAIPRHVQTLMMFHDMGYFFPFPSRLYTVHQIPEDMGLMKWIRYDRTKNPLKIILLGLKRGALQMLKHVLRNRRTRYLVPSSFMKPFVEHLWQGKGQTTHVLPHFMK